jgi:hypothetical protein
MSSIKKLFSKKAAKVEKTKTAKVSPKETKVPEVTLNKGPLGELKLDDMERMRLLHLEAEVRAGRAQFSLGQVELRDFISKVDPSGTIFRRQADVIALGQKLQTQEALYNQVVQEVEAKLNIKLKEYSFDDTSGVLHKHESGDK